jgi:sensor domain CHASE-containing protein
MSLRAKILLILSLVFVVYAGLDHALQQFVVFRNFRLLEEDGAERDVQRVVQAVGNEVRHGRALDAALVEEVSAQTGIDFDVWPLASTDLPAEERALLSSIVDSSGPIVRAAGREMLHAYATLQDAGGAPAMLLRANLPRDITGRGAAAVRYGLLSTVFAGLLLMLVLLALLQRTVIRPIAALTEHAVGIGRGDDPRKRLSLDRATRSASSRASSTG